MKQIIQHIKQLLQKYIKKVPAIIWLGLIVLIFFAACYEQKPKQQLPQQQTYIVKAREVQLPLYFSGTVKPLHVYSVTSPVEGAVAKKYFNYGQQVKKGDVLLSLSSSQLSQDYQTALTEYLKAKESYTNTHLQQEGSDELYRLGIISKNTYREQRTQANDAALAYMQAKQKLLNIINKAQLSSSTIINLDIAQLERVNSALSQYFTDLKINAPADGIILMPDKSDSSGSEGNQKIDVGTQIKNGQLLLSIGDLSGISFLIHVNEVNINAIKAGQAVTISSSAFPGIILHGKVTDINLQASTDQSGGLPNFEVRLTVPSITPEQRQAIHVGMSANVELIITKPPIITVPIKAVQQRNNKSIVKIIDKKTKKISEVTVVAGQTSLDMVEIQQGLAAGDEIIIND